MENLASFDYIGYITKKLMANEGQELVNDHPELENHALLVSVGCKLFGQQDGPFVGDHTCGGTVGRAVANAEEGPLLLQRQHAERIAADLARVCQESDDAANQAAMERDSEHQCTTSQPEA
jgi:hypothetical protein